MQITHLDLSKQILSLQQSANNMNTDHGFQSPVTFLLDNRALLF